ncbi:MAG: NAD-dependent dihydropyrimidine dehydrogenase subunit PreA [Proteobacteria bacterium]|nr:NAD-dependent dihydropyrimidine dehydrogenase subunit PreA [Pseudomonadota bacterium]MBU1582476.1 NAD-dependent dihydropyrimidine dehydrogenase subunit PreA [Pseudomonadota bacterium]MBU2454897.1 NAD-dependent dihydropyrimidine dehydrogenase subunit PreA [Pseudomonadota bacterium]
MNKKDIDLSIDFCGVRFKNPFLLSSSPVSNSAEMVARSFDAGWSGVVFKTLNSDTTPIIHPSPRMNGYGYGNKRLVGLQNVEMISDRPLKDNLTDFLYLKKKYPDHVLISSIMGFSNEEWAYLAKVSEDNGADMLELNFSCPHMSVEGAGHHVGKAFDLIEKFTTTVKNCVSIPVIAKMTPNITDMTEPAIYAKQGGADAISAINTVSGISQIDLDVFTPKPNVFGLGSVSGTSGPAVKPIGLRFISEMAKCEDLALPLSGIGGIETWIDALEYILLGASTIQVTTGIIHYGYGIVEDMIEGLTDFMVEKQVTKVQDLVGKALVNLKTTDKFDLKRQGRAQYDLAKCVGCGQCYTVCKDAGGFALEWDQEKRRPVLIQDKCLSCMICSFVCPVLDIISFTEMPATWKRQEAFVMDRSLETRIKYQPFQSS